MCSSDLTLVNPLRDVGPSDIHGVTPTLLRDAPKFGEIAPALARFLQGCVLVAHNKNFDLRFLIAEFERVGIDIRETDALCTMELFSSCFPRGPRKLSQCCEFLGMDVVGAHEALSDARMAANIAKHILRNHGYPVTPNEVRFSKKFIQLGAADPHPRTRALEANLKERHFVDELVDKLPTSKAPIEIGRAHV